MVGYSIVDRSEGSGYLFGNKDYVIKRSHIDYFRSQDCAWSSASRTFYYSNASGFDLLEQDRQCTYNA